MDQKTSNSQKIEKIEQSEQRKRSKQALKKKRRRPSRFRKQNSIIQKIALERIEFLMETAIKIYSRNSELGNKYVDLARKYSMASKVRMPTKYKNIICHKCKQLLIPSVSSRHRIQSRKKRGSRYVLTCLNCNHSIHIYFKQKKTTT
ncbi:MAG: ribonuclease P protein component 4 [Promethearchaeota archaeon]